MIDESQTSPVPDVLLLDEETDLVQVIIEITHTQGVKKDLRKLQELMHEYSVPEGFVYDYRLEKWYRYQLATKELKTDEDYCQTININLAELLH